MTATNPLVTHDWKGQVDAFTAEIAAEFSPERSSKACPTCEGRRGVLIPAESMWDERWIRCADCFGTGLTEEAFRADQYGMSREHWPAFNVVSLENWEEFPETYPRP